MATKENKKVNSYVCIDFETGGLDCRKNPVTEFAAIAIEGVNLNTIVRYDNIVKPYDKNLIYEKAAINLTGLSPEVCERDGIDLELLVVDICQLLIEANIHNSKNFKPILFGHNIGFDIPFLQSIFKICNVDLSQFVAGYKDHNGNFQPKMFDTIDLCKMMWALKSDNTTKYTLAGCCEMANISLVDSHRAMADVGATVDLFSFCVNRLRNGELVSVDNSNKNNWRVNFEW